MYPSGLTSYDCLSRCSGQRIPCRSLWSGTISFVKSKLALWYDLWRAANVVLSIKHFLALSKVPIFNGMPVCSHQQHLTNIMNSVDGNRKGYFYSPFEIFRPKWIVSNEILFSVLAIQAKKKRSRNPKAGKMKVQQRRAPDPASR